MKEQSDIRIARQAQIAAARAEAGGFIAEHLSEEVNSFTGSAAPEGEEVSELSQVELIEEEKAEEEKAEEDATPDGVADEVELTEEAPAAEVEEEAPKDAPKKKETAAQKKKRLAAEKD